MRLLLDTHIFIWACANPAKLSEKQQVVISDETNDVFVSAASVWEISIKRALGRIDFPIERFEQMAISMGFESLDMTIAHALAAGSLPRHHEDPFDRMLVAQAQTDELTLVSVDAQILRYDVSLLERDRNRDAAI